MTKWNRRTALFTFTYALCFVACSATTPSVSATSSLASVDQIDTERDQYEEFYATKGLPYRNVVKHSLYLTPILNDGQPRGYSRIWGDASPAVQRMSIEAIRSEASKAGMSRRQEAMVLAIAYVESGFNPDAAAGTTSAQGLGQFIRSTGSVYGLTDDNRWDVQEQARALVEHTWDNYAAAQRAGLGDEYVYALHHDGSLSNEYGGVDLANDRVVPKANEFLRVLNELAFNGR